LGEFQKEEADKHVLRMMKLMKRLERYSMKKYADKTYEHNTKTRKLTRSK
jgi:hypothetical protein